MSRIYLDSAKFDLYDKFQKIMPLAGVTSNPSILAKEYPDSKITLSQFIPQTVSLMKQNDQLMHIQCVGKTAHEFVASAKDMLSTVNSEDCKHIVIKVPGGSEGLKAISKLSKEGIPTTATGLYRAMQAIYAAESGAKFVVLYINRMEVEEINVRFELESLRTYLDRHGLSTKILTASFKKIDQITAAFTYGSDYCTVQPDMLLSTIDTPLSERDNLKFYEDSKTIGLI